MKNIIKYLKSEALRIKDSTVNTVHFIDSGDSDINIAEEVHTLLVNKGVENFEVIHTLSRIGSTTERMFRLTFYSWLDVNRAEKILRKVV